MFLCVIYSFCRHPPEHHTPLLGHIPEPVCHANVDGGCRREREENKGEHEDGRSERLCLLVRAGKVANVCKLVSLISITFQALLVHRLLPYGHPNIHNWSRSGLLRGHQVKLFPPAPSNDRVWLFDDYVRFCPDLTLQQGQGDEAMEGM